MAAGSSSARTAPGPTIYTRNQRPAPAPTNGWSPPTRTKIRPTGQRMARSFSIAATIRGVRTTSSHCDLPMARSFPIVQTDADERNAQFSPDGRWVVYQSNESGRFEIWVQPFSVPGSERRGKWQISNGGGGQPRWSRDGRELFYLSPDSRVMAVPIKATADGEAIETGEPERSVPLAGHRARATRHRAAAIHGLEGWTAIPVRDRGRAAKQCAADDDPELENEIAPRCQILFFAGLSSGWDNPIRATQKILPPATRVEAAESAYLTRPADRLARKIRSISYGAPLARLRAKMSACPGTKT